VALLAALLAFCASFVEKPAYKATSRMLVVEGSTPLLNSSGQPTNDQTGVDGATSAQTIVETLGGLASSRQVATMVVDKLDLDAPQPPVHGPVHWLEYAAASTYAHVKAWVKSGFYKTPAPREKAIQGVEAAITVNDLAPTGGPDTGQADSYVLELDATGQTAVQATQIADAAAADLVVVSQQQFENESQYYATALAAQLRNANATLASDNQAVSNYEVAHNVSSLDQQLVQNVQDSGTFTSQLVTAQAAVEGEKQTVASLQATLAGTDPTETSAQNITTGRSTTADDSTQVSPVYQTVQEQLSQAQATLANDTATASSLQSQLQANPSSALTQAQAGLLDLEQQVTADQNAVQSLSSSLQQADANVQISPVDLTRLGAADLPTYPFSPKRYLYLLLGVLLGALAGCWLTYLARRRVAPVDPDGRSEQFTASTVALDLRRTASPSREPVSVGAHAGTNANNGHNGRNGNREDSRDGSSEEHGEDDNAGGSDGGSNGCSEGRAQTPDGPGSADADHPDAPRESTPS
jgi:uncharacterized protein involved in exopolysaccharide biosynthesis